ncbi:MAG: Xaa-Pro peptidase family protein [Phycisphaerales bacterium]
MAKRRTKSVESPHAGRIRRLRALLKGPGVDHLVVSNPMDVAYLTGFLGGDSWLIVGPGKATLVSDFRYQEEVESFRPLVKTIMRTGQMADAVADELAARGAERIGVQGDHMTLSLEAHLKKSLRRHGYAAGALKHTTALVSKLRAVKDETEVALIRKAIKIQEGALEATLDKIEIGMSELDVGSILEFEMKARGSSDPSFATIVGAGANSSQGHYSPSEKAKIRANSPVLIDWGATWRGYHSDMTRVVVFGTWPRKIAEIYQIVLEAHEASAAALRPGAGCREVDAVARKIISDAGYGDRFGHGLGHGIGLNIHEAPGMGAKAPKDAVLEEGNVVTIEPGVYLPGVGGVRIENDYLVTGRGSTNLCSLPRDIRWATRR